MPRRDYAGAPVVLSATTVADGSASFVIPAGQIVRYDGAFPIVVSAMSAGLMNVQVTSEPVIGADLRTATAAARTVTVQVARANLITSLLSPVTGLVVAGAGITVRTLIYGV